MKRPPEYYTGITENHPLLASPPKCCELAHFIRRGLAAEMGHVEEGSKAEGLEDEAFDMQKQWPLNHQWFKQMVDDAIALLDHGEMPDLTNNDRVNILARAAYQLEQEGHSLASMIRLMAVESLQRRTIEFAMDEELSKVRVSVVVEGDEDEESTLGAGVH